MDGYIDHTPVVEVEIEERAEGLEQRPPRTEAYIEQVGHLHTEASSTKARGLIGLGLRRIHALTKCIGAFRSGFASGIQNSTKAIGELESRTR